MPHEISTTDVLHNKVNSRLGLEAGVEIQQERVALLVSDQEYSLLGFRALDFVILDDKFFLQHLDSIELLGGFCLREHDFTKVTFS